MRNFIRSFSQTFHIVRRFALPSQLVAFLLVFAFLTGEAEGADSVCAKARIEISQEVAFERQAFEARMTISNDLPGAAVTSINVGLRFFDAEGNPVNFTYDANATGDNVFFVRMDTSIPESIATGTSSTLKWLIIPTAGAGGTEASGNLYFAGATLTYSALGRTEVVEVAPDYIFVKPQPLLVLDYFFPDEVFGDDPLTTAVEPIERFTLGLRIHNDGSGAARGVAVSSGQPRIVRNDSALAVSFSIKSAFVNDIEAPPVVQLSIGDLNPGAAATVGWELEASLYGRIVGFDASYSHADELGGRVTSLMGEVRSHTLLGMVEVDLAARDSLRDFLAISEEGPEKVFESEGLTTEIPTSAIFEELPMVGSGLRRQISAPGGASPVGNFVHLSGLLPSGVPASIRRVVRSDGKVLPTPNAWISKKRINPGNNTPVYERNVHIFDTGAASALSYEVEFGVAVASNQPPLIGPLRTMFVKAGTPIAFTVKATDSDGTVPAVSASQLPSGATFSPGMGTGAFAWTPSEPQIGNYVITFHASDGVASTSKSMLLTVTDPNDPLVDAWKQRWFNGETNPEIVANWADPDADGLSNLLEYALDLDPTASSIESKPVIGKVLIGAKNYLTLTYVHRTDDPDLVLETVASSDVRQTENSWVVQSTEISELQDDLAPGMKRTTFRDSVALEDAGFRFLRLKVALEP